MATENQAKSDAENTQVSRIAVRIPPFWKANVKLWIAQCDNAFRYSDIKSDETKYSALVANIDAEVLSHVSDIVLNPPDNGKYDCLCKRLISEFEDSETQKIKKLLNELHLGDERPSHLLRKMKELAGNKITDDFLQNLWLQRMPSHIQAVLSASSEPLEKLATIADKVSEVASPTPICSTTNPAVSNQITIENLAKKVDELTKQINLLQTDRHRPMYRINREKRSLSRKRSCSRNREDKFCFYHERFGDRALKCKGTCNYKAKNGNTPS